MKNYAVDLHIHSALSPCSSNDMLPENILGMAKLKGLDIISITDHNSGLNVERFYNLSKDYNIKVIPGIEVNTKEEVHVLCYFENIKHLKNIQKIVENNLKLIKNDKSVFGEQLIVRNDGKIENEEKLLVNSLDLSFDEIVAEVDANYGICVPAHVDRQQNSIMYNLGFIPENQHINCVEISSNSSVDEVLKRFPTLENYSFITSSDAHFLGDILEREVFLYIESCSFDEVRKAFNNIEGRKVIL